MNIINLPLESIVPYARNPRKNEIAVAKVVKSIQEFGFAQPIVVDANFVVISGHTRLLAAKELKLATAPVIVYEGLTEAQTRAFRLADNRVAQEALWDEELLKFEFEDLKKDGFDLVMTGFNDFEIDEILNPKTEKGLSDENDCPESPTTPITVLGDIYILGEHRLMCGDSTNPQHVQSLCADHNPVLMVTDPPYGVKYDPEWREGADLGVGKRSKGKVLNDDKVDWTESYSLFTGDVAYVWHAAKYTHTVANNLESLGFGLISQIIWAKQHFVLSRGDYHWQHEPCWYAVRNGQRHRWQGARDQSTLWEIKNNNSFGNSEKEKTWGHGTQKPVDCMLRPILNNTKSKDYVYDPFGGSGTTLIACEKSGRKCLMMELDPKYCDMIVQRYREFTGKEVTRLTS